MKIQKIISALALLILLSSCSDKAGEATAQPVKVDGKIVNGLREISVPQTGTFAVTVYRGDYIVLLLQGTKTYSVKIPGLKITKAYPAPKGEKKYIKMKKAGTYAIEAGTRKGTITVTEYSQPHYRAVSASEAQKIINNIAPLVLDVRTPMEHQMVRIDGSKLVPIQVLQKEIETLAKYRNREILLYCATGNRSTVAAKILIDNGFKKIYNMRYGIAEWQSSGLPVKR